MFINIDYNRRPQEAKFHLAKPNKQILSIIHEKFRDSLNLKLGSINELNFSIPYEIDGERNNHVDMILEKMLIKLTLGSYQEWYIVDEIGEDGDDTDIFNVKAFSLGYELQGKRVKSIAEESINAESLLTKLLKPTSWKIGYIDPTFNAMFRSFDISDSNVLDCIIQASETYGALIEWDTHNNEISFERMENNGSFRGMTVNYGRFLRSVKRTRTTDEMVTRLYVYGNEDMSIYSVNPTGQNYIENFDYFMYPFERDPNTLETIKSSHYMSDELCHAILDHEKLVEENAPQIKSLQDDLIIKQTQIVTEQSVLDQLNMELDNILQLLDMAKATENEDMITQRESERDAKLADVQSQERVVHSLETEIDSLEFQVQSLQDNISYDKNFTQSLRDELNFYIIEKEWRDDRYTDVEELYNDGLKRFQELREPKVVIDVTIDNLLNIIEEQYYWDKLVLGDIIKVKYPQMNIEYMAKIIEINYDLDNGEASIKIANTKDLLNETEKLIQLLNSSSSASSLIENNKYKWDKINAVEQEINAIISQEWDANKQKIIAGVNNSIEVGNRGIIIQNPDFPDEVVIMQSGIIALSKDGGETWKTAIKPDGVVAERLIGQIITGQELIITNGSGTFTFDNNGVFIDADSFVVRSGTNRDVNLRDVWNGATDFVDAFKDDNIITAYEKRALKTKWVEIKAIYDSNIIRIDGYYGDTATEEIDTYKQKYQSLYNYLFVDTLTDGYPLLDEDNIANSTRIDRYIFEARFNEYESARVKVEEILSLRARELANNAQDTADDAQRHIDEVENDIVYKIEIHSSNGLVFKNDNIQTTLTARVYRGKNDITTTLSASQFIWRKYFRDGTEDTAWYNEHIGVGNVINVTKTDVDEKATFSCDVDIIE